VYQVRKRYGRLNLRSRDVLGCLISVSGTFREKSVRFGNVSGGLI
jgi:hypothetical protein